MSLRSVVGLHNAHSGVGAVVVAVVAVARGREGGSCWVVLEAVVEGNLGS